ncbi:MAG: DUF2877 domain-containing protein [Candidatus Tectomicrobia bacterium]|uniref:DUF2877 domain-containing protein n=1 Tax=Tectimicrobiota bacterium TaxID=2528274 RepID=A0A938AZP0_UNCTE|nr:DUF2877 domain-containing protein [Candidatus Tectomicrobia bacterium]
MRTVEVHRWSQAAARLLPPQQAVIGRVHSCYARILNVQTPRGRLLTLQGEGPLQAPLGLALGIDMTALGTRLPVGALVLQEIPTAISLPAALRLRCADALVWDGQITVQPDLSPAVLAGRGHALTSWLCCHTPGHGLAPLLRALEHGPIHLSATNTAVYTALAPLWTGRQALTVPTLLSLVSALVGLGEGLTPSGDDFLVGLLAVLHVTGFLSRHIDALLQRQFCQCVRQGTSQLSGEFLRCALAGHFAEPLAGLVRALCGAGPDAWLGHAATLATVGHSSGVDAMVGIVWGCQLLA